MAKAISRDALLTNLKLGNLSQLTGANLKSAIEKYNLIICTPTFVVDTTNYNLVENGTVGQGTIITGSNNGDTITLIKDNLNGTQVGDRQLDNKDGYIIIALKTITKIIIKSRRNFMENQQKINGK